MNTRELIFKATDGICRKGVNGLLWWFFLLSPHLGTSKTSYGAYKMFSEADEALKEINYDTFKQLLSELRRMDLIERKGKRGVIEIKITQAGLKRLKSVIPQYEKERPWDGNLYLISYDIAEIHHRYRDEFREYLRLIGCAILQESLWVTPYNPRTLIEKFSSEHELKGTILVSKLGKDGAIGEEDLQTLLDRVYHLTDLNKRYDEFIEEVNKKRKSSFQLSVMYASILQDDPQLPFDLLPKAWLGDSAYSVYKKIIVNQTNGR